MIPRFACLLLLLCGPLSAAEEPEKPDPDRFGQPLIRVWFPSTLVADHQQFEEAVKREVNPESEADKQPELDPTQQAEISQREGILIYYDPEPYGSQDLQHDLVTGPPRQTIPGHPWFRPVRFVKVGTREEFEKELEERTVMATFFPQNILEQQGDGFVLKEKESDTITWINGPLPRRSINIWNVQPQKNLIDYLNQTSRYWTYRNGYMFFGDFEEILEMDFPDPRTLSPKGTDADRDIFVQVDLNAVLPRQKRILWNLIRKEFERSLQQSDDEGDAEYAFRKSVGDLQLNLIQAVTQDLESIKLGIDFASEDKPAKAELELVARPRVNLEHYFGTSGIGTPSLAAFVEQPAAMTLATSWGLPDRVVQTLEKLQLVVDEKLAEQRGWTVDAILASEEMAEDLLETIRGNNQIAVKLKQTEHGFTLYGGMRVQNAERVSKNLALVLNGLTTRDGWGVLQSRDQSGRTYFSFRPEDLTESVTNHQRKRFPAELHFTVVDEILWFSIGRQDSLDILSAALDRIKEREDQPVRSSIPLALFDMSLDGMFPDKDLQDSKGFDRLPLAMVEKLDSLIPRKGGSPWQPAWVPLTDNEGYAVHTLGNVRDVGTTPGSDETKDTSLNLNAIVLDKSVNFNQAAEAIEERIRFTSPSAEFTDYGVEIVGPDPMKMQKFLQPEQSRMRIQFDADEKRVRARASVGIGVIKHIYSRMMETQNVGLHRIFIDTSDALLDSGTIELNFTSPQLPDEP